MPKSKTKNTSNKKPVAKNRPARSSSSKGSKHFSRLLGVKDYIGEEGIYFQSLQEKARLFAEIYGFRPAKTPTLENLDLYKDASRRSSDKEIYKLETDKGENGALRPELTQGILRAYLDSSLIELPESFRFFSLGQVFRKEKMQNGHWRESTQLDLEIIGEEKSMAEALLIAATYNFFNSLNLKFQIQINSLGKADCRKEYISKLNAFYKERGHKAKLCNNCKKYIGKNMLALLDCQEEACQELIKEAPQLADCLSDDSREHFAKVLEYLDELGIPYNFNPYLVRGLSYYNDTVYEFWPLNEKGNLQSKFALAGGGRYDSLADSLGGPSKPAAGIALGLERIFNRVKDRSLLLPFGEDIVFLAQVGDQAKIKSLLLFEELRQAGFNVRQSFSTNSLKQQMEEAVQLQAKVSLILGKKEVMDETILLRDMESGVQETVAFKKIQDKLNKKVNRKEGGTYG